MAPMARALVRQVFFIMVNSLPERSFDPTVCAEVMF